MNVLGENTAEVFPRPLALTYTRSPCTRPSGELETRWSSEQESLQTRGKTPRGLEGLGAGLDPIHT